MPPRRTSESEDVRRAPQDSGALARGLAILDCLLQAARPLTLAEISESTQLPSSTVHRQLQTLEQLGRTYRDMSGRHCVGIPAVAPLPLDHPLNMLRRDAIDVLRQLQAQFSATALLTVFLGTQRLVLEAVTGSHAIAPYIDTQVQAPLHCSVSGKLLLSTLDEAAREHLLGPAPYAARTASTITKRRALFEQLDRIAQEGLATNLEENVEGISAQGVLVSTAASHVIGALTLTGPTPAFTEDQRDAMRPMLVRGANMLGSSVSARAVARFSAA
ncbi:MAG: Pca regulon regulatory protein [Paracidovorax wautersii]|uniref:Pca regulon regulatory protein n=1 Tax=Paracidovorax wautersii TaxID=1177982 RepID=A0A7V8FN15_9BURK|nr:MAG: Pca regulon regulatory protein [Paracidovorax wautersii]